MAPSASSADLLGETTEPVPVTDDGRLRRPKSSSDVTWLADPIGYPSAFPDKVAASLAGVGPEIASAIGAASLGQAILLIAKVTSWSGLGTDDAPGLIPGNVRLTTGSGDERTDQVAMLSRSSAVLGLLRASVRASGDVEARKGTKLSICLKCGRWLVASSAPTSKSCPFTEHCPGAPFTVPNAERLAVSPEHLTVSSSA